MPCSRPTVGGKDRNNGWRHLAEDLRKKKILSLQQLLRLLHCGCSHTPVAPKHGVWTERPHTSRRPSQTKPVVSSLHYPHHPSPSLPDTEQRDRGPIQQHQRAMSFVPPGRAPLQACTQGWGLVGCWTGERVEKKQKRGYAAETENQQTRCCSLGVCCTGIQK